ncbi:uncharacterized protein LOC119886895 isoform X2 [Micropterus salmoides]|uniref:uncharacterized protein LOC119886895 isoform X2 n=2 Tax=Micropterus salmoides TaxID=27706 RepID=UPI0018EA9B09|nr:uncharacterized protein LOC119886895 isoform X2 [Micropterus salmoides]
MSATIETTVQETSMKTMLEGMGTFDTHQTKEDSDQVKENALVGTFVGVSQHTSSSLHSSSTVDQQLINQTSSTEMPEEELPNVCSVTEEENKEGDVDTELFRQDNYLVSESHLKSDGIEYSITAEIATEKSSPREHTEPKCSIEKADFSSLKEELSTDEEQKDHVNFSKVRGAQHSEDAVNEVHEEEVKPTEMQEKPHMDYSLVKESESSLQTQQSKMNAHLDSQPLDNSQGIKEQTHTGFKPTAIRRKLGSSRRNKGIHQEPKEEFAENTRDDDDLANSKLSLGMAMRQKELKELSDLDLKHAKKTRKIRSAVNDEDTTPEEDLILSQNVMDNSTTVTTIIKEPKNLSQLTGNDTVKMDSIQWKDDSNIQNISYHDDNVTARSVMSDVLEQDEAFQVHNTEALTCDKDSLGQEVNMQQTNDAIETVQDVTIRDYSTEVESFVDIQVSGQDDVAETIEHPRKKDHEAQEMTASLEITRAANNRTVTWAPFDKENFRKAEPAGDMSEESGISTAVDASDNQQGIQKINNLENGVNLQGRSKEKRRKMGSTRGSQLNRKPRAGMDNKGETKESNLNIEADMRSLDKMEEVDELPMNVTTEVSQNENANPSLSPVCKEELEASTVHDKGQKLQSSASDLQSIQSSIVDTDDLKDLLPEQSFTHNEEDACPVNFVQAADVRDSDLSTQNDEERPECVNVIQNQALTSAGAPVVTAVDLEMVKSVIRGGAGEEHKICQGLQEPSNVNVVVHDKNPEMKNASPNLNSTNRRRKMGSTRKNLGSQTKGKDLLQNQKVDDEARETATNVGDIKNESFSGIKEEELQLQLEYKDSDSEQRKEKVFETVAYSHTGESHFKPPAHQTFEENPVSHGQPGETEHQLHPRYVPAIPSTSPKHDVMSETESGRRKRKMGSHRKSRGYQNNENQAAGGDRTTDTYGRDAGSITDESAVKTNEEESLGLDKISEVSKSYEKASPSTSKAGEHSRAVSEKTLERVTAVQHPYAEIHLAQESQNTFSLGNSGGADLRSNSYNVVMVGDSSVGKTSFMKRAQSGKFSLDLPASVGLDSCMWTVVVDGKPVVLQLWDTAGQERFHSITRQIFHKAQAFLLMYDISSSQSFSAISYWASCIQEGAAENVTILLLGNKSDHAERQVKTQQGEILAKEYNFEFMECSAATGENVIQSLETMARMLSQKADTREEAMVLHKEPQQKKSSGCC